MYGIRGTVVMFATKAGCEMTRVISQPALLIEGANLFAA